MSEGRSPRRVPPRFGERLTAEQLEIRTAPPQRRVATPERAADVVLRRPLPDELNAPQRPRNVQARISAPRTERIGAELAAVLRDRAGLRRAVLLNEILGPPVALRDAAGNDERALM